MREYYEKIRTATPVALIADLFWIFCIYFLCRIAFLFENRAAFAGTLDFPTIFNLFSGGAIFDISAIFYTNSLFIVLFLLAGFFRRIPFWYAITLKIIYLVINGICILANLADSVFFATRLQRSTAALFSEFGGDGNFGAIIGNEIFSHWYFIIFTVLVIWFLSLLYLNPRGMGKYSFRKIIPYSVFTLIVVFFSISGMRGAILFSKATRPISVNYAFKFTTVPAETGIVLNTPFSVIRTIGETAMTPPDYFTENELDKIYSPVHYPEGGKEFKPKNLVILIMESFSKEFVGGMNRELDNGTYKGYTPYLDLMLDSCLWYDEMIANTFFSIDAPPAVFASIPRVVRPFTVSPQSLNHINSIASELKLHGYESAFFHGADNESLGFNAFVRQAGFDRYFGMNEFLADKRFGGKEEFDGTWGIWDEPFLQYFCTMLGEMKQPFLASVFTLSSHHPFKVPEKYKDVFKDEGIFPLHKAVKYSDFALHRFFEEARKQTWFENTIFIITADHSSSKRAHTEYKDEMAEFRIPILIYDPSGELPRGKQKGIFQQIDIMPTILDYLGHDRPYIAFGKNMLTTPPEDSWAFNWNELPTYIKGDYLMVLEDGEPVRLYNYKTDPFHKNNLLGKGMPEEEEMRTRSRAIMQSYLTRMQDDNVTFKTTQN